MALKFVPIAEVIETTGLSKSSIYRLMDDKLFPSNIQLSPRRVAWDMQDVFEWMEITKSGSYKYWE